MCRTTSISIIVFPMCLLRDGCATSPLFDLCFPTSLISFFLLLLLLLLFDSFFVCFFRLLSSTFHFCPHTEHFKSIRITPNSVAAAAATEKKVYSTFISIKFSFCTLCAFIENVTGKWMIEVSSNFALTERIIILLSYDI